MSINPLSKMKPEVLYGQLRVIASTFPDTKFDAPPSEERHRWMGRAHALIAEALGLSGAMEFQLAQKMLGNTTRHETGVREIVDLVYRALGVLELELPAGSQGSFIPAGNTFDAMAAVGKILASAKREVLIVDPYLDEKILTEFAQFANVGVLVRLLGDVATIKGTLGPAAKNWVKQFGNERPLSAKVAAPRSLHDRLILVDQSEVWTVGQSFNALAGRAPTSFNKVDAETAGLKIAAYETIWAASVDLPR
jgi:hypothetical protein